MRRRVFIISAPLFDPSSGFYHGVLADENNLINYFMSPTGGAYSKGEIIRLRNPSLVILKRVLLANQADYAVLVFSGHGHYNLTKNGNTHYQINQTQNVSLSFFLDHIIATKRLFILDNCRSFVGEQQNSFVGMGEPGHMLFPSYLTRQQARKTHIRLIQQASPGTQILHACDVGEKSKLKHEGSYFCTSLLRSSSRWAMTNSTDSELSVQGAFNRSMLFMFNFPDCTQTPQFRTTKPEARFPFALKTPYRIRQQPMYL